MQTALASSMSPAVDNTCPTAEEATGPGVIANPLQCPRSKPIGLIQSPCTAGLSLCRLKKAHHSDVSSAPHRGARLSVSFPPQIFGPIEVSPVASPPSERVPQALRGPAGCTGLSTFSGHGMAFPRNPHSKPTSQRAVAAALPLPRQNSHTAALFHFPPED